MRQHKLSEHLARNVLEVFCILFCKVWKIPRFLFILNGPFLYLISYILGPLEALLFLYTDQLPALFFIS